MLARRIIGAAGGGGAFSPPPIEDDEEMRTTVVKRTSNTSTPFDYHDATPPSGVHTDNGVITWSSAVVDTDSIWDAGTKLVIPSLYNGKYGVFYANGIWSLDTTYGELKIFRNGALDAPVAVAQATSNAYNTGVVLVSVPIALVTADYFELCAKSGDAATLLYAEAYSPLFALEVRMA